MRSIPGGQPALLRRINEAAVLSRLHESGPLRLAQLAERAGLSRPTVVGVVESLAADGLVDYINTDDAGDRKPGRPARLVRLRPDAAHVVGLDIGPHKSLVLVADLAGRVVAEGRLDTATPPAREELLRRVRGLARDTVTKAGIRRRTVRAVGAGTPGIVDPKRGLVLRVGSMPDWRSVDLAGELTGMFGGPVFVENDVNLAVLAERWRGAGPDAAILVAVQWGARVGAGILIGEQLLRGANGAAGELGLLPVGAGRVKFEAAVGAPAIARLVRVRARQAGAAGLRRMLAGKADLGTTVFAAMSQGDPAAAAVVEEIADRFVDGLIPLIRILDPDLIVIGGGTSRAGPVLLDALNRSVRRRSRKPPPLALSVLGDRAVALGATRLALDHVEQTLFTVH